MNARWYDARIGRFISADVIIPNPADPQNFNRYTYVRNSPINFIDPTGHGETDCLPGEDCDFDTPLPAPDPQPDPAPQDCYVLVRCDVDADDYSTPCTDCPTSGAFGDMFNAYEVYLRLVRLVGRSLTYEEVLALLIAAELGSVIGNVPLFEAALEGLARQFYERCGSGGVCTGDQLWKFLGSMQGWFNGDVIEKFKNGSYRTFFNEARRVLTSDAWRSGAVGNRPYHYGNLEWLFGADLRGDILSGVGMCQGY
jgi:hypothetical protein